MPAATPRTPSAYLRTKVMTASPQELRLMLLEGAIRFAEMGRDGLTAKNFEQSFEGVTRCQAILIELINGLRPEHDSELCKRLSALYTFMYTRLIDASQQRDAAIASEVIKLLQFERETWILLMEKLEQENLGETSTDRSAMRADARRNRRESSSAPAPGRISVQG